MYIMKNAKKTLLALVLSTLSATALADVYGEVGFGYISTDIAGQDLGHNMLTASAGYNFNEGASFQNKLELTAGYGIGDDDIAGISAQVDHFYGLSYRPTYQINDDVEIYGRLMYSQIQGSVGTATNSTSVSDSETGYGIGAGYKNFTFSFTKIDEADLLAVGYSINF